MATDFMVKIIWVLTILIIIALLGCCGFLYFSQKNEKYSEQALLQSKTYNMKITSSAFENNEAIPEKYTCEGTNVNPPLEISEIPEGAQSLVLIVADPDASAGTWHHWIVYNIAPETTVIGENSLPNGGIQLKNDFGKENYGGPCPPSGNHGYFFKVYALDEKVNLPADSKLDDLEKKMAGHILDQGQLIGLYQRNKK